MTPDEAIQQRLRAIAQNLVDLGLAPDLATAVLLMEASLRHVANEEER